MDQLDFEQKHRPFVPTEILSIGGGKTVFGGISVREYMATHILNGILCREDGSSHTIEECVEVAIKATDILQQKLSDERLMDYREMRKRVPHNPNPTMQNPNAIMQNPNAIIKNDSK